MTFTVDNLIYTDFNSQFGTKQSEYDRNTGQRVNEFASDTFFGGWLYAQLNDELLFIRENGDGIYRYDNLGNNLGLYFDFTPFNDQGAYNISVDNQDRIIVPGDPKIKRFSSTGEIQKDVTWDDFSEVWGWDSGYGTGWDFAGGFCVDRTGQYAYVSPFYFTSGGLEYQAIYKINLETGNVDRRFATHLAWTVAHSSPNTDFFQYHAMVNHPSTNNLFVLEQIRTFATFGPFSAQGEIASLYLTEYDDENGDQLNSWLVFENPIVSFPGNYSWQIGRALPIDPDGSNVWVQLVPNTPPFTTHLYRVATANGEVTQIAGDMYNTLNNKYSDNGIVYGRQVVQGLARLNPDASEEWFKTSGF